MYKEIMIWVIVIGAALLITEFIDYRIRATHQVDCNNHKILLYRAEQEFPNASGLNGQTIPEIQYLNNHCSDLGMGNYTIH